MNQIDLNGRRAIVTGGARGIGFAAAERFVASGASVALWDIDGEQAKASAEKLSAQGTAISAGVDHTDADAVAAALAEAEAGIGEIDILVNSAGINGSNQKTWEYSPEEWRKVLDVDLVGPFVCCRAVVPGMMERGYGRIINISSVAGKEGNPNASHYSAAKAGLIALTRSLGKETAQCGIIVNAVTPATTDTEMLQDVSEEHINYMLSKIPMGRLGRADEMAAIIAWLASEECSFSTAAVFDMSGGRTTY
jgi:3-oxoacyl-[acyl-carrier protein] reductase